jgi:hypothetical protein
MAARRREDVRSRSDRRGIFLRKPAHNGRNEKTVPAATLRNGNKAIASTRLSGAQAGERDLCEGPDKRPRRRRALLRRASSTIPEGPHSDFRPSQSPFPKLTEAKRLMQEGHDLGSPEQELLGPYMRQQAKKKNAEKRDEDD